MILKNGDGLEGGGAEGVHRREVSKLFHQDLLSPLGIWAESEHRPQQAVCYRVGIRLRWWWGLGLVGRRGKI